MKGIKYIVLTISLFTLSLSAIGQSVVTGREFSKIVNEGSRVRWEVNVPFSSALLRVSSPDGSVFEKRFGNSDIPAFSTFDLPAESAASGVYYYEFVVSPIYSPSVYDALVEARANGNFSEFYRKLISQGQIVPKMTDSGSFQFRNGSFAVKDSSIEVTAPKNERVGGGTVSDGNNVVVVADDQVVLGSQCVGVDCTDMEVFQFATMRLKENNTRIDFTDTSNSAEFPTRDWRIGANESANGSRNGFFIYDLGDTSTGDELFASRPFSILGGASTDAFVIDSLGRIGLGTSTPSTNFHVFSADTPTARFEQDGSVFSPYSWDLSGNDFFFGVTDVTGGSLIPFQILPGSPTRSLVLSSTGTGISVPAGESPSSPLTVFGAVETKDDGAVLGGIKFSDGTFQTTAAFGSGLTEVSAGDGLTGGGTTGAVNLTVGAGEGITVGADSVSVSDLGITTAKIADNAVVSSKIASNQVVKDVNGLTDGVTIAAGENVSITPSGNTLTISSTDTTPIPLGSTFALQLIGSAGSLDPGSFSLATIDAFTIYKIRYRDSDGSRPFAGVRVKSHTTNIDTGIDTSSMIFDSQSGVRSGSTFVNSVVCVNSNGNDISFETDGMWLEVEIFRSRATELADIAQIQIFRGQTCP